MGKYEGIPELLEQFMEEQGADERWVSVQELRDRFVLTRYQCNTVSGFLRRLEFGTYGQFPFIVIRIEQGQGTSPARPPKCRYLVKRRDQSDAAPFGARNTTSEGRSGGLMGLVHTGSVPKRVKINSE
ncbi:MAG: hypothetical protein WC362_03355 [Methanoregula sp.]|jgi:hypothetical protein